MEKNLYIDASHPDETRVVLKSNSYIEEYEYENKNKLNFKNNIYLGVVSRVEPSLQAAFVNFGRTRHGFLAFNDIQSDYYQIPTEDKEKLKEAEERIREELKNSISDDSNNSENAKSIDDKQDVVADETVKDSETPSNNDNLNSNNIKNNNSQNIHSHKREKLKNTYGVKKYRIQEVIKPGQVVLIQVIKEERGQKGAALTTFISLAGKYIVLMPNTAKGGGISRKIMSPSDRKKIRTILNEIEIPKSMGIIVRTAGANKTKNEIEKDFDNTIATWDLIRNKAVESNAPSLIYEEGDIVKRALRDMYDNETKNIFVEGNEGYQKAKLFMKELVPKNVKFVKKYRGKIPLFHDSGIEKELNNIFEPVVKLKSGGYIVINPTEALISIDINSGQSIKSMNIEKTALNTNLEAAEEIGRQIKIRDLSGLIVIDFIDMMNFYNRRMVEKKMRESVKKDRARIQIGRISNFGLLEMTRQRLREASIKWETSLSIESFSLKIIKKIEMLAFTNKIKSIRAYIPEKIKIYIESFLKKEIDYFQEKYGYKIELSGDSDLLIPEYSIELLNKNKKIVNKVENLNKIEKFKNKTKENKIKSFKNQKDKKSLKSKKNIKKNLKSSPRTLWMRKK